MNKNELLKPVPFEDKKFLNELNWAKLENRINSRKNFDAQNLITRNQIDDYFEGEYEGKKQIDWINNVKNKPWVDIRTYSGATITEQMENALVSGANKIFIPKGLYSPSGRITVTKWPIFIQGAGMYDTVFDVSGWSGSGAEDKLFYFDGSGSTTYLGKAVSASGYSGLRGVFISDFGIEGDNASRANGVIGIDSDDFYHEGIISRIRLYRLGTAIDLHNCWGIHLEDNKIAGCYDGVKLAHGHGASLFRNYIYVIQNCAVKITDSTATTIRSGAIEEISSASSGAIQVSGNVFSLTIEGVYVGACQCPAIYLSSGGDVRVVRIMGNYLAFIHTHTADDPVVDLSDAEKIKIEQNFIARASQAQGRHISGTGRHIEIGRNQYHYWSSGWTEEQAELNVSSAKFVNFEGLPSGLEYVDDFIGDDFDGRWLPAGDAAPTCAADQKNGLAVIQTPATTNNTSYLNMNSRIIDPDFECDVFINAKADQTDQAKAQYILGLEYQAAGGGDHYIYFENGPTNWVAQSDNGTATPESTSTGIAVDTSFHEFRIKCLSGHAYFFIDGAQVADHSTKVPTANHDWKLYCKTLENVAHNIQLDRVRVTQTRS